MLYVGLAALLALLVVVLIRMRSSGDSDPRVSTDRQIDGDVLQTTLEESGVEVHSTNIPDPEILRPYIADTDTFLGAVQARRGNKRSILVALGDRLVAGEATLGTMGAEVRTLRWDDIDAFDQTFDIGGQLEFEVGETTHVFSHVPRSETREFSKLVRGQLASIPKTPSDDGHISSGTEDKPAAADE